MNQFSIRHVLRHYEDIPLPRPMDCPDGSSSTTPYFVLNIVLLECCARYSDGVDRLSDPPNTSQRSYVNLEKPAVIFILMFRCGS